MVNFFMRTVLLAALCFAVLVVAETYSREAGAAEPRSRGVNDPRPNKARLMRDCDKHITECGVTDEVKVVTKPASTIRVQETVTTVITKELPNIINVIYEVEVTTINDKIQGHCRNTTIYVDPKPAIVTEYVTVEHVKELVSIINTTTTITSTVTDKTIEQCFINTEGHFPQPRSMQTNAEVTAASQSSSPPAVVVDHGEVETEKEHVMRYHRGEDYAQQVAEMSPDMPGNVFRQREEPELEA
ncbi:uncharacterized protein B0J16DRAFT_396299 [Fusarium flagelliforme]|uniref:Uncharacterized protein n=1 Tax=Fusarium flagelliforme TaxID=2675880 RepID=A0A395N332_9HYPO|nr:uncharacterized protein B0J16DRAFT_396299 [Fusarium flagelliforme]KAH7188101.1 hypothetical protein B0J16DRAFT_396299 [Fusarium flagelliforme]RFN54538.1 hypothetical protein FIE12Z_1193 [Fusarium flagelliforme]